MVSSIDPPSEGSTYRPIGEVATLLRLQPHVLRFWETKFKQIAPLKRSGGRRYYRREDVRLLFQIRDLLYVEGYTLRGAQKALRAHTRSAQQDKAEADKADEQKRADASPTPHLSHAVRADLLRITERLEHALARCSAEETNQEKTNEEETNEEKTNQEKTNQEETNKAENHEQEIHEQENYQENYEEPALHDDADSREQ